MTSKHGTRAKSRPALLTLVCLIAMTLILLLMPPTAGAMDGDISERVPEPGGPSDNPWTTILTLNPAQDVNGACLEPYSSGTGYNGTPQWVHHALDLSAYANKTVRMRFSFDTRDPLYNKFEGWYVDNIRIDKFRDNVSPTNIGWQVDGSHFGTRWHITGRRDGETKRWSWWYGNEALETLQAGDSPTDCSDERNWGTLTSPPISLGANPSMEFDTLWEIESVDAHAFDIMTVQIEVDGPLGGDVRTPPYDFITIDSVSCVSSQSFGTGEVTVDGDPETGRLLVDVKARSLFGSATGRAGVGIAYVAPRSGVLTIKATVDVKGVDQLILVGVPELDETAIVSLQSGVYIAAHRVSPIETTEGKELFASRILAPDLIPLPIPASVDGHSYNPPESHTGVLKVPVGAGDALRICAGIESKTVATGLVAFTGFSKVLYGNGATLRSIELALP